jgi:hypothetical protein
MQVIHTSISKGKKQNQVGNSTRIPKRPSLNPDKGPTKSDRNKNQTCTAETYERVSVKRKKRKVQQYAGSLVT